MLRSLRIKNFKTWEDTGGIRERFVSVRSLSLRREQRGKDQPSSISSDVDADELNPRIAEGFFIQAIATRHLHPKVQSELADLFIEAIQSRENGSDRADQFIVESQGTNDF
jgi:hypothetical protein